MYNLPLKINAMVHSLESTDEVTIIEQTGDNQYVAEYRGNKCTAIFNPFTCLFYVDDVYGILS